MADTIELYQGAIKFMPNWYMLFKSRDTDKKKLEFLRTILEYAFESKVPDVAYRDPSTFTTAEEYAIFDAFWAAKPLVDAFKRENLAGREGVKGGRPRKETLENPEDKPGGFPSEGNHENPGGKPQAFIKEEIEIENIKEIDNAGADAPASTRKKALEEMFARFWKEYPSSCPRKYDKQKCLKKWLLVFRSLKDPDAMFKSILDGLARWKASKMWNDEGGQYIMGPHRWLNGRCWEDSPPGEATEGSQDASEERAWLLKNLARTEA